MIHPSPPASPPVSYYVRVRRQESGPFTPEQIKGFLLAVQIGPKTPCRAEGDRSMRTVQALLPEIVAEVERLRDENAPPRARAAQDDNRHRAVLVTTEAAPVGLHIEKRLGIVTAEVVFGVNVLKELLAGVRNVVGGRSETLQQVLKDARETVLDEMQRDAYRRGADAVVAVSLNYNDITTGGTTILFLVGAGTAVRTTAEATGAV